MKYYDVAIINKNGRLEIVQNVLAVSKDYVKPSEEKTEEEPSEDETATDSDSTEEEKTAEPSEESFEETAVVTYQGKNYRVNKAVFEKWLAENGTLTK